MGPGAGVFCCPFGPAHSSVLGPAAWSLNLTSEAGFIVALLVGLVIGNFLPRFAAGLQAAIRPEWYIKTAIVLLGGFFGVSAAKQLGLANAVMFRGLCR